ncbi:arylamine N-acetyltransferase [Streptomyces sp. NA02950]|uniref:arylamine N-acetyltransferase family protein n=1 Tax=Streptomyces sp. NA02950 TaxID=2742137 RepID=UPI0015927883|nr:arylamine N-acetyltransferase [Streptomyces sp. NA02950]QKV97001.1 arylamine N-acetyltransferase [Streptomyces sp. NA02950]
MPVNAGPIKAADLLWAVDDSPEWGSRTLDLDAYFARVGYDGPRSAAFEVLRRLHRAHMSTICFENVDIALGREVRIDLESIQRKLVRAGRGGYCYENNLLFAAALDRLGFPVTRLLARIREGDTRRRARSHTCLLVKADGVVWLADPGYGHAGLIEPIPLAEGATSTVAGWTWQLGVDDGHWVLRCLRAGAWFDLYAFRPEPQYEVDFQAAHYCSSTRPGSPFVGRLIVQRGSERARHLLRDQVLVTEYPDGRSRRTVLSAEDVPRNLRETFGTALTGEEERLLTRFLLARTGAVRRSP